jgi:hypothetical protein
MSRRHHGRPHHTRHRIDAPRPDGRVDLRPEPSGPSARDIGAPRPAADGTETVVGEAVIAAAPLEVQRGAAPIPEPGPGNGPDGGTAHLGTPTGNGGERSNGCTAPQLRRFIKSRPYVPMHELRRRFGIDGSDDDVTRVPLDGGEVFVGLPNREGLLLGELLRGGEIGYELSFDPRAPIVVGVYPMRPVPRG